MPRQERSCPARPSPRRHQTRAASPYRLWTVAPARPEVGSSRSGSGTVVVETTRWWASTRPVQGDLQIRSAWTGPGRLKGRRRTPAGTRTRQCWSSRFPPRSPSGRSPERDLQPVEQRAPQNWEPGQTDRRRLPPRPRRRCPRRAPGRPVRGNPVCGSLQFLPPRDPVVGRDDVETCAGGRCRPGWSGRLSAAPPGAECRAASSGTPTMHAGPREHKRRWQPAGGRPVVGLPCIHAYPLSGDEGKTAGGVDGDGARYDRLSGLPCIHAYRLSPRPQRGAERRVAARRTWAATGARSCAVDAGVDPVTPAAHDRCARWRNPHPTRHREVDDKTGTDGARVD